VHRAIVAAAGSERLQQFHNSLLAESQLQLAFLETRRSSATASSPTTAS